MRRNIGMENDKIRFWDAVVGMKLISASMQHVSVWPLHFIPEKQRSLDLCIFYQINGNQETCLMQLK